MKDVKRYNPDFEKGLSSLEVMDRVNNNLINYNVEPPTKSIKEIVKSNFFTYFNFINIILGGAIIVAGVIGGQILDGIKNSLFMGVALCNSVISIIQEIISKKTIDKLSVIASAKVTGIRDSKEVTLVIEEIVLDDGGTNDE